MKAPTNYEEAVAIAEKLDIDLQTILIIYGIENPDEIGLKPQLDATTDIDAIWEIYNKAPTNGLIRTETLKKILKITTDIKMMWRVYREIPGGSPMETEALQKILDSTNDIDIIWDLYTTSPYSSQIEVETVKKLVELAE